MTTRAHDILAAFYDAVCARDLARARTYLADDMQFIGLFETYPTPERYLETFAGLLSITERLTILQVVGEGDHATVFMEMKTREPAPATTLVAEWHELRDGKIVRARSAFDARPFATMFGG